MGQSLCLIQLFCIFTAMSSIINASFQVVPTGVPAELIYPLVDKALDVVAASGLIYEVGALETTLEGPYKKVMDTIEKAHQAVVNAGAPDVLVFIKLQLKAEGDVNIQEKIAKWR